MTFSEIRTKEVVNTADGRKLGKICDMVFCYPENRILGFVVPASRSFSTKKSDFFIDLKNIVKIGDDVILVNVGFARANAQKPRQTPSMSAFNENFSGMGTPFQGRRSYEDYE